MRLRTITFLSVIFFLVLLPTASLASGTSTPTDSPTTAEAEQPPRPDGPYVTVRLIDESKDDAPVVGVSLTVASEDGTEVGEAETDAEGRIIVPIPELGRYTVTLDEDTLPDGIELSAATKSQITIVARISGANGGLFPIGVQAKTEVPFSDRLVTALMSGIKFGLIVALAALGLSLIFGTTGLTNFAHGELITFGALATYVFNRNLGMPVLVAGVLAVGISAAFGWAQDRGLWRPLRRRGTGLIAMMIVSIGLSLLLRNLYQYIFGSQRLSLSEYVSQGRKDYGPISLADKEVAIIVVAVVVITLTCVMLLRTRLGKSMRAVSDNPALAASSGMKVDGVISSVWILGTAITGLAGVLLAINSQINFLMGFKLLLLVFAGVTLGGLGTIWGALFGSMIIGLMVEVGPLFGVPSSIKEVGALVVLIIVLLVRPQGVLGRRERVG